MSRSLFFSFFLHAFFIYLTALTLPFMLRDPIDLPPIVSVEFIEIKDTTNIPYAPKARKIIEKVTGTFEEHLRIYAIWGSPLGLKMLTFGPTKRGNRPLCRIASRAPPGSQHYLPK